MSLEFDLHNPLKLKRADSWNNNENEEEQNEEERLLEQDIEGNSKKRGRRQRKGGIDVTQYNDDSSDDEYAEAAKKSKNLEVDDGSDSDMFGSDDDDNENSKENDNKGKTKTPKVEFLDLDQFEKENEVSNQQSDNKEESEEDDENDVKETIDYYNNPEERRANKKVPKNEPKLDAFNLKNEKQEGRFDTDGNFIQIGNSDNEENDDDGWLKDIKKKDIKRAKTAQEEREQRLIDKEKNQENLSTDILLFKLITLLKPVESPLEALQRLNKHKPKHKKRSTKTEKTPEEQQREKQVIEITEYSESLIEKGFKNVYELEKEELMLKYKEESGKSYMKPKEKITIETPKSEPPKESLWQFRWLGDTQVHGPYGLNEIVYWKENYFNNKVEVRKIGEEQFVHIEKLSF